MAIDSKSTLTVAAAFAAAMLAAPASHANTAVATEPITTGSDTAPVPSLAALQRLEKTAQLAWWWWPIVPPKFVDLWPEVTHVETVRTA
jgi:hypothetical protein